MVWIKRYLWWQKDRKPRRLSPVESRCIWNEHVQITTVFTRPYRFRITLDVSGQTSVPPKIPENNIELINETTTVNEVAIPFACNFSADESFFLRTLGPCRVVIQRIHFHFGKMKLECNCCVCAIVLWWNSCWHSIASGNINNSIIKIVNFSIDIVNKMIGFWLLASPSKWIDHTALLLLVLFPFLLLIIGTSNSSASIARQLVPKHKCTLPYWFRHIILCFSIELLLCTFLLSTWCRRKMLNTNSQIRNFNVEITWLYLMSSPVARQKKIQSQFFTHSHTVTHT